MAARLINFLLKDYTSTLSEETSSPVILTRGFLLRASPWCQRGRRGGGRASVSAAPPAGARPHPVRAAPLAGPWLPACPLTLHGECRSRAPVTCRLFWCPLCLALASLPPAQHSPRLVPSAGWWLLLPASPEASQPPGHPAAFLRTFAGVVPRVCQLQIPRAQPPSCVCRSCLSPPCGWMPTR